MEKYQRGKVYAIICNKTGRRYVGSTCEPTLAKRLAKHVSDFKRWKIGRSYLSSYDIIKDGDYHIVLLESYPCNSRDKLRMCEQKHINECINKLKAFRSEEERKEQIKQYAQEHCDEIAEYKKEYHKQHRNEIIEYQKEYLNKNRDELNSKARKKVSCSKCQKEMNYSSLSRHQKSCA